MTIYAVLAPAARAGSARPGPDRFVFVKEGFCWPAFYATVPWLIWHWMWLVLAVYIVAVAAISLFAGAAPSPVGWTCMVLFAVLFGLEGNNLRRWTLERRGYRFLGVAAGDRRDEAEYRFFAAWTAATAHVRDEAQEPAVARPIATTQAIADEIVGLFPRSGAR